MTTKKLPKGWSTCLLEDLITRMSNGANVEQYDEKFGYPITRIETIWNENIDLTRIKFIKENDPDFVEKYRLESGDILFSHINSDSHLGKTAVFKNQLNTLIHGVNLLLIRPSKNVLSEFLNYQFKFLRNSGAFIDIAQRAVNQSSINQKKLKSLIFLLPPLNEQKRIVAKIEELFSALDNGLENLLKAQELLKIYRQSLLKNAFEGKLTKKWRENNKGNLKTIEQLLTHISQRREVFYLKQWSDCELNNSKISKQYKPIDLPPIHRISALPQLPNGWGYIYLGSIIEEPKYGTSKKCSYDSPGLGVLRIPNIIRGTIETSDLKFAKFDQNEISSYRLLEGDILTIRSNGSISLVGKCSIITKKDEKYLFAGYLIRLRPLKDLVIPGLLVSLFSSQFLREQIESTAKSTSGVNNINSKELQSLIVPFCGLEEQELIVSILEKHFSFIDSLERDIQSNLFKLNVIRQSILRKAFSGELVHQDPNDEPANELLKKNQNERAIQNNPKRTPKKQKVSV